MPADFRSRLLQHEPLLGALLTLPSPEVAEILADAGFDWLFIDMEHGLLDLTIVQRIGQAVAGRCACVVRVPTHDAVWIKKVLDIGVAGLIVPQVNTPAQAAEIVRHAKYPPVGVRSVGLARAQGYGAAFDSYVRTANEATAIIVQVEHIESVRNVERIISVAGVDCAFVGPFDLAASMNKMGQINDPEVQATIARVRQACAAKNTPAGIFAPTVERGQAAFADGFTLVAVGMDVTILGGAARKMVEALKSA